MLLKISLVVALCGHVSTDNVQKRLAEIQAANPKATISVRLDKKASCDAQGNIIKKTKQYSFN